jgi:class 3 adenylate cyclase/tetratricopeptide (TPR) repeat protein
VSGLGRYVPGVALSWPGPGSTEPVGLHRHVDGTLVFVDVSGFTALSERLAQRGKVGAEQLTDVLNTVFGTMLGLAAARGGTLLKFGGDALFLLFEGPDHPAQAASAAVEMRSALAQTAQLPSTAGRLTLRMSVGVHTGLVDLFLVGSSHRELVVAGPATTAVAEMEAAASAGQILLSPHTAAHLPASAVGDPLGPGRLLRWRRPHAILPDPHLRPTADDPGLFVPTALRGFLAAADPESEHRTVGVAFLRYTGLDALLAEHGHHVAAGALHQLVTEAQAAADAQGVTFLATDLAEDGGKIIFVAGFPTTAEDDQGRLVRAACDVVDASCQDGFPLDVRAGINRGHVFAGAVGSFDRATVTVMGDTVNLAARVMTRADADTVLATPGVLDAAQTLFATEPVEPFMVKGKSRPVTAYVVGDETGNRPPRGLGKLPFLGREAPLATVCAALMQVRLGHGGVLTLAGDAGMGKTRLLQEALTSEPDLTRLTLRAEPYGAATPYRPVRDPLRQALGLTHVPTADLPSTLRERVSELDPALLPWLPLLGDVLSITVDPTPATRDLDPQFRPERTAAAVIDLLAAAFPQPLVVAFDDAHYSDDATAALLTRLERETQQRAWLLLATRRDADGGYRPLSGTTVPLSPLDDDAVRALILQGTAAAPLRPHDVETVLARVAGNPLFLEETLRNLRDHGDIDALPSSLEGMVAAQIDALPPLARRLVRRASVLGRSFRIAVLTDLFDQGEFALDDATRRELADILESDGRERLRFRHALLRDAAYDSLPFLQRRQFHLAAAKSIHRRAGPHPEAVADNLALHYWMGGDAEQTWRWARVAGDQARAAFANDDAAAQYQRALAVGRRLPSLPQPDYFAACMTLGDVLEQAGRYADALKAYRDAQAAAEGPADVARVMARRAVVHDRLAQFPRALSRSSTGLRAAEQSSGPERTRLLAELWTTRAAVYVKQERYKRAWAAANEAERFARGSGEPGLIAHTLNLKEEAAHALGRAETGQYSKEALRVLEGQELLRLEAMTTGTLGVIAFYQGRWDDAAAAYRESGETFQRVGDLRLAGFALANVVELLVLQQRHAEADDAVAEAIRAFRAIGLNDARYFTEVLHARSLLARGDAVAARDLAREASEQLWQLGAQGDALLADLVWAEAEMAAGDAPLALSILDDSAQRYRGDWDLVQATACLARGKVLTALGRYDDAVAELRKGLVSAQGMGLNYEAAQLTMALADVGAMSPDAAEDARRELQQLGVRFDGQLPT